MGYYTGIDDSLNESEQQTRDARAVAMAQNAERQAAAREFITTNGHEVVGGHSPVGNGESDRGRPALSIEQEDH
jgi:hypothetical protein